MVWLYRLQQRLSLTRHEGIAILTLAILFVLGLSVRYIQEQDAPPLVVDSLVARSSTSRLTTDSTVSNAVPTPSSDAPLNINTASRDALKKLPGVGPVLAKRIERYRSEQRPFQRVQELQRVTGIGPATVSDIRPMVHIAPSRDSSR